MKPPTGSFENFHLQAQDVPIQNSCKKVLTQLPPGARHGRHDRTVSWVAGGFWSDGDGDGYAAKRDGEAVKKVDNL